MQSVIKIYTDGSCHTQLLKGAWASILFIGNEKIILSGSKPDTTHNRMELLAVIKAIDHIDSLGLQNEFIQIYSDSQYVVNLVNRKEKLNGRNFITKKGTPIQNIDLVKMLIQQMNTHSLEFVKVKAHEKDGDIFNREVDLLARQIVRERKN